MSAGMDARARLRPPETLALSQMPAAGARAVNASGRMAGRRAVPLVNEPGSRELEARRKKRSVACRYAPWNRFAMCAGRTAGLETEECSVLRGRLPWRVEWWAQREEPPVVCAAVEVQEGMHVVAGMQEGSEVQARGTRTRSSVRLRQERVWGCHVLQETARQERVMVLDGATNLQDREGCQFMLVRRYAFNVVINRCGVRGAWWACRVVRPHVLRRKAQPRTLW